MSLLSVIVPCYNEQEALPYFYDAIVKVSDEMKAVWQDLEFEYLFIDDGSKDDTLAVIEGLREKDKRVRYVSFSRNFGKEAGLYAGLSNARGDLAVTMDADMQDPPALLPDLYRAVVEEGYDSAATRRVTRKGEPPLRSFFARMFYRLINRMSAADIVDGARDYRIMNRRMIDTIVGMKEYNRFTKGIYGWIGFDTKWIEFENVERVAGETKWSFWKLFKYALEGIIGFSTIPLSMATWFGLLMSAISFIGILFIIVKKLAFGDPTSGWSSMVCIILLVAGIQLFCMGVIGQYLSKAYLESKHRPIYIAKKTSDEDEK
ncbi:MAG TPA: glycosyltransferase [Lachnospiraceae bacterium]|nr:glycosyltransferase family 2 protein [Lachnospiraceae bacterium]HAL31694.1 glycosyltransferase [Lachnospiraceae bacterium]HBB59894.1 glycosyltransferase [Lachnospiraceae bacterium]